MTFGKLDIYRSQGQNVFSFLDTELRKFLNKLLLQFDMQKYVNRSSTDLKFTVYACII